MTEEKELTPRQKRSHRMLKLAELDAYNQYLDGEEEDVGLCPSENEEQTKETD